jgi:hypothetical protein
VEPKSGLGEPRRIQENEMLTQEQINEAVKGAMPDIMAGLRKEIAENAIYHAKQAAFDSVQKAVNAWITENLVPEIIATLAGSKDGLLAMAPQLAQGITGAMIAAFTDSVTKKLESSWERKKIFEALLA